MPLYIFCPKCTGCQILSYCKSASHPSNCCVQHSYTVSMLPPLLSSRFPSNKSRLWNSDPCFLQPQHLLRRKRNGDTEITLASPTTQSILEETFFILECKCKPETYSNYVTGEISDYQWNYFLCLGEDMPERAYAMMGSGCLCSTL